MDLQTRTRRVARYLARVRADGAGTLEGLSDLYTPELGSAEAPAGLEAAIGTVRRLEEHRPLTLAESRQLEAIILPLERPVAFVQDGTWAKLPARYETLNRDDARERLRPALAAIGRINIPGLPTYPYAGTGFLVGPGLLLTNRHVAQLFARGLREAVVLEFDARPSVDLRCERERAVDPATSFRIVGIVWIHPHWDAALVRVEGNLPEPLHLQPDHPEDLVNRPIAVVGYPARDPRSDLVVQDQIFQRVYQVKRFQPGLVREARAVESFSHQVDALTHDASTLGGNSGSAVIDIATGHVVGLHFGGVYLDANFAVPAWELAQDPHVRDAGVQLSRSVDGAPGWLGAWGKTAPASTAGTKTESPTRRRLVEDWWERLDDATLRRLLQDDPAGAWDAVREAFGDDAGAEYLAGLSPADGAVENPDAGLETPADPIPGPPIVFLHGILGSHLHDTASGGERVWLDLLRTLFTDLGPRLSLKPDGTTDARRGRLDAVGHLQLFYGEAARAWTRQGFDVRPFAYDWRKSVDVAAERLHLWLSQSLGPNETFHLVAHSMGGLVAATYADRFPEHAARHLDRAVLVGSPIHGAYAPVECLLGTYPFLQKLAMLTPSTGDSLRAMAATLPGLVDMLPDPAVFDGAAALYDAHRWPERARPAQAWLDRSRALKERLARSPLFDPAKTTLIVGATHGTVDRMLTDRDPGPRNGRGDGTVPIHGALVDGIPTFLAADNTHDQLLRDPAVITAVADLFGMEGAITNLPPFDPDRLPAVETPSIEGVEGAPGGEPDEAHAAALRARLDRGEVRATDVFWLYAPGPPAPPTPPAPDVAGTLE